MLEFNRPTTRRLVIAFLVAVAGALLLAATAEAQVHYPNPCKGLTPSDPTYWLMSCWAY